MDSLYKSEVDWINTPTIAELTEFRKKKLKQVIDVMIEFSSAGKEKESFAKYGLDIPNYDYQKVLEEKVFKKLSLDEQLKEQAEKVVAELMKQERIFSHCDLHSGNILVKGDGDIAIIDPLSASYANRFFDIAYLLEQAEIGLNKDEKSDIINYFIEKLESNREHLEKPQRTYDLNAALINLREAAIHGNKNSKHYNESLSQTHLKRANQLLEELFPNMPLQA